jgi:uncharacterized repeat protein (TIGR03803 family)
LAFNRYRVSVMNKVHTALGGYMFTINNRRAGRIMSSALFTFTLLCVPAFAQGTLTVLHSFSGLGTEGERPQCTVTETSPGVFYGTTLLGPGRVSGGTIFSISGGVLTTLRDFNVATEGQSPEGSLLQFSDGNLYGANTFGGSGAQGTLFKSTLSGTVTVLRSFSGRNGSQPFSLVRGSDGNLYGTAEGGAGQGLFLRVSPTGTVTSLHSFTAAEGTPAGPVIQASDGNFYGTTTQGTSGDNVYRITRAGALTIIHTFSIGSLPAGGLLQASSGQLYGVTQIGSNPSGFGTLFRMTLAGTVTTIHTFTNGLDGGVPQTGLMQATDSNIYGTTSQGGAAGGGTIFQVTPTDTFTTMHSFILADGIDPETSSPGLVQGSDGKLIGVTTSGGASNGGTLYSYDLGLPKPQPRFTRFSPTSGPVGTSVLITGLNLLGATSVTFNGTAATYAVIGANYISAAVPAGATTGPITVVTPNGTATSRNSFTVQ